MTGVPPEGFVLMGFALANAGVPGREIKAHTFTYSSGAVAFGWRADSAKRFGFDPEVDGPLLIPGELIRAPWWRRRALRRQVKRA